MSRQWIYLRDDDVIGPLKSARFKEHVAAGKLRPDMKVALEGGGNWVLAESIKGLFSEAQLASFRAEEQLDRFLAEQERKELLSEFLAPGPLPSDEASDSVALPSVPDVLPSETNETPIAGTSTKVAPPLSADNRFVISAMTVVAVTLIALLARRDSDSSHSGASPSGSVPSVSVPQTNVQDNVAQDSGSDLGREREERERKENERRYLAAKREADERKRMLDEMSRNLKRVGDEHNRRLDSMIESSERMLKLVP